jgi:hypothetical protein
MAKDLTRREFIKTTAVVGAGLATLPFSIIQGRDKSKVRIGVFGVESRDTSYVRRLIKHPGVENPAIFDVRRENSECEKNIITEADHKASELYTRRKKVYKKLITRDNLDGIIIVTPWRLRVPIAIVGMKTGKYVGWKCWLLIPLMVALSWSIHRNLQGCLI